MGEILSILDFDETYDRQDFFRNFPAERLDFRDLDSASRFCSNRTFFEICRRLGANPDRRLTFLGGGNYHYVTSALTRGFSDPFSLVVFDHHADYMEEPSSELLSCGGWIRRSLAENGNLRRVFILGADPVANEEVPRAIADRILTVPNPFSEANRLFERIPTEAVYLSIDKDVLDPGEAETDWDQGNMAVDQLLKWVSALMSGHRLLGADVCGEPPRTDSLFEDRRSAEKNGRVNRQILDAVLPAFGRKR